MAGTGVTIVGGGNLGGAIVEGLLDSGHASAAELTVTRRRVDRLERFVERGVRATSDNRAAAAEAEVVIVCVEPFQLAGVLEELAEVLDPARHVLVSCVSGVSLATMRAAVGDQVRCLRAMPNTAVAIRESVTCIATENADDAARARVQALFQALGTVVFIEEELMGAATVLGACGVAFSMRFVRAASQGGIEIGFDAETARLIAAQTVQGAASLLLARGLHPEREIDKVTTPQGCTIAGLNEMEHRGFSSALIKGITTSFGKIRGLASGFQE